MTIGKDRLNYSFKNSQHMRERVTVVIRVCLSVSVGFRSWLPFNRRKWYELELDDDLSPFYLPFFRISTLFPRKSE